MLDSQDIQKIEEAVTRIVTQVVTDVVMPAIQRSEERMYTEIRASEDRLRGEAREAERRTQHFVRAEIRENNAYLIQAVATMINDNVAPQFADVHRKIAALATT